MGIQRTNLGTVFQTTMDVGVQFSTTVNSEQALPSIPQFVGQLKCRALRTATTGLINVTVNQQHQHCCQQQIYDLLIRGVGLKTGGTVFFREPASFVQSAISVARLGK